MQNCIYQIITMNFLQRHSASLKGNKAKMSKAVKTSDDSIVVKIREQVTRTNRFLEQETLINV